MNGGFFSRIEKVACPLSVALTVENRFAWSRGSCYLSVEPVERRRS
jgi:hypothetical protein